MKKALFVIFLSSAILVIGGRLSTVAAEEPTSPTSYNFDTIEVPYAAEFVARPMNVAADSWVARVAGGVDRPITVLYGAFYGKRDGEIVTKDEFIKISGTGGSERFLINSSRTLEKELIGQQTGDSTTYGEQATNIGSFFWSAKKLDGTKVVKDFSLPIISVSFYRHGVPGQGVGDFTFNGLNLSFSNDGMAAADSFWNAEQTENLYKADLSTLRDAGLRQ